MHVLNLCVGVETVFCQIMEIFQCLRVILFLVGGFGVEHGNLA